MLTKDRMLPVFCFFSPTYPVPPHPHVPFSQSHVQGKEIHSSGLPSLHGRVRYFSSFAAFSGEEFKDVEIDRTIARNVEEGSLAAGNEDTHPRAPKRFPASRVSVSHESPRKHHIW